MTALLVDSIAGQVLNSLCTALRAMTVAGGYHWNVATSSVQTDPLNILGMDHAKRPFFLLEASPNGSRVYEPASALTVTMKVILTAIVDAEGASPDRKTAAGLALAMDIEKAVAVDITRGGLCSDTRLSQEPEILTALGTDNSVVVIQELECRVHREYGAP